MSSTAEVTRVESSRWGWRIVLSVAALLTTNGIILYAFVMSTVQEQTIAILVSGLGLQALVVGIAGLRSNERGASNAIWALFVVLVVIGIHVLASGSENVVVSVWYLFLAAMVASGQILTRNGH